MEWWPTRVGGRGRGLGVAFGEQGVAGGGGRWVVGRVDRRVAGEREWARRWWRRVGSGGGNGWDYWECGGAHGGESASG